MLLFFLLFLLFHEEPPPSPPFSDNLLLFLLFTSFVSRLSICSIQSYQNLRTVWYSYLSLCFPSLMQLKTPSSQQQNLAEKYFFNRSDGKFDTHDNFYTLRLLGMTVLWLLQASLYNETNHRHKWISTFKRSIYLRWNLGLIEKAAAKVDQTQFTICIPT